MRVSLEQRLRWLENGHEGDTAFHYLRAQKLPDVPMNRYFSGNRHPLEALAVDMGKPVEEVEAMTFGEVLRWIDERWQTTGLARKLVTDALWQLATPYFRIGRRRQRDT